MLRSFYPRNISFKRHEQEDWLVVTGEITNNSGRNYNAVVFRMVVFIKSTPIGNAAITINGFYNGQTRTFERQIEELGYSKVVNEITRCEVYAESAY